MTDFCCWMPIIIISILSLTGNFYDPHKIAFVWIAVFVLPLNSSLNPILYTFSTERTKRSLSRKRKNITGMVMKTLNSRAGDQSTMDYLRTYAENTLVSTADSSPQPVIRIVEKRKQKSKQVNTKLKLIEVVDIFKEDTAGKRSTGYVTAWCEEEGVLGMVLLKYFGKEMKEDWTREIDIVQDLSTSEQSIEYGNTKIHEIQGSSWLICYDFESSSTLEDFLSEKGVVIDFDAVCAVACDVISAIERLQDYKMAHNNITTGNILISQCSRVPPIKAVLGGFSQASTLNGAGAFINSAVDEQSCHGQDIEQFGHLLATLLGHCHGSSEYVKYNGKHYKQLHGTAMGSPVSVVIAEIVMQNIEERALSTCRQTIPLWLRYVDDTFTAVRHDEIDAFHNHLNEQNTDIQFTREVEENGKLPFLDCLVSHNDNSLRTTVYRKPTHTDRLLDESSYNPTSHKATTIRTLTRRAQLVCDSTDSLSDENKYLHRVFTKNNYNNDFIRRNTHRPTTTTETNDTATPTTTATIPYIKGMSENISRILLPFNIRVAHKPITTLRQLLTNVKDKDEPRNRQGTIYKINCSDCQASYIGETGRNLTTRLTEHRRATRKGDVSNHIAEHHRLTNHNIDWDSAQCLTYSTDYFQRLTLESWFTNLEQTPLNRCQQLPAPYKRLIHDINITNDRKRTT
ncbi:G-protein coupled receptor GRL101 [Stylophora pistillata]|uniref:G-protein coupled receptor GRL101 n=1 Tax=Stylophora pistillata TaxID=50429 RepID=A0A2B4R9K7_STYPI|nr:G-protein coupled receptor GRL101 [Stylophora pistillata]